jgi:DNA-binding beta-propeller fold protein YncE
MIIGPKLSKILDYSKKREYEVVGIFSISLLFFLCFPDNANGQHYRQNLNSSIVENNSNQAVPWIGAEVTTVTSEIANVLGMNKPIGVLITEVTAGSPAETAGLIPGKESANVAGEEIKLGGDIIIKADNKNISFDNDFTQILRQKKVGDTILLTVLQGDRTREISVTVGSRSGYVYESSSSYAATDNILLVPYESFELEVGIQYPLTWEKIEDQESMSTVFKSNPENSVDYFQEFVVLSVESVIGNETLPEIISNREHELYLDNSVRIRNSSSTTIADNSAHILEYDFILQSGDERTAREIIIENDRAFYYIAYIAQASKFDDYLPTIKNMVGSVKFLPVHMYENSDIGIRMKYFNDWDIKDESYYAIFSPPFSQLLRAQDVVFEITASDPVLEGVAVQKQLNHTIQDAEIEFSDRPNFKLIASTSSSLENMDAIHNVTSSYGDPHFGIINTSKIITVQNNRVYSILYYAGQDDYSSYAPIISKMIKSIEFFLPVLHPDTKLGLLLQYPSNLKIAERDNGSITFTFDPSVYLLYPTGEFIINVTDNSYKNQEKYRSSIGRIEDIKTYVNTTLGQRLPAQKIFSVSNDLGWNENVLQVITTFKDRIYNFTYSAEPDEFRQYVKTVEKIINSTKIIDSLSVKQVDLDEPQRLNFTSYTSPYGYNLLYNRSAWNSPTSYGKGFIEFATTEISREDGLPLSSLVINVLPSEDTKIYDFVDTDITFYTQQYPDFKIFSSNQSSHGNHSAYYLQFIAGGEMYMTKYILNDNHENLYAITYSAKVDDFYKFLPIIEQMISPDYFEFTSISELKTYTGFKVHDQPWGIGINHMTNTIYVANSAGSTVSAINASNNEILADIEVDYRPMIIAVNSLSDTVYVTHSGSVSVISGKNNTVLANIPTDIRSPLSIALNPYTDRVYVADGISKNVSVIDSIINQVVLSIPTGISQEYNAFDFQGIGVAVDPLRNRIYVANPSTGNVTVIDGSNNNIISNISASEMMIRPFDIAVNPYTDHAYIVGDDEFNSGLQSLAQIDLSRNIVNEPYNINGTAFNVVALDAFRNLVYINDAGQNSLYVIDPTNQTTVAKNITMDTYPVVVAVDPYANVVYTTNLNSDTVTKMNGTSRKIIFGVNHDINDRPMDYDLFGIKFPVNASKSVIITCNEETISDNDYIHYDNGTNVKCLAQPRNVFSPIISSSWSGFNDNGSNEFTITEYGTLTGTIIDLEGLLKQIGPAISIIVLFGVVLAASIPSLSTKIRKVSGTAKVDTTIISKGDIITVDATVIIGVLIFISFSEGFEISEQTQISIITANIVFPFAISAVLAVRNYDKFAIRLMIAGFINLMISVVLIAIMRI